MSIDLDELERLATAATPGPWTANNWGRVWCSTSPNSKQLICDTMRNTLKNPKRWRQNAKYIAAACNSLPDLIAENRELKEHAAYLEQVNSDLIAEANEYMKKVQELERQREWLAEFISYAFAGITPAKQFIEWAEEAAKEAANV